MSLRTKKKSNSNVPPLEAGTYPAVCVGVIDLGEQYNEIFKKYNDKLKFIWELPSQRIQIDGEDKPRWLSSRDLTNSFNEKSALYQMLVSWRGKAFTEAELTPDEDGFVQFSVRDMLGKGCLLQVIVEEKDHKCYNNITSVIGLPTGMEAPEPESPLLLFDLDDWDDEVFHALPGWIQERIQKSTQYQKYHVPTDTIDVDTGEVLEGQGEEATEETKAEEREENPI